MSSESWLGYSGRGLSIFSISWDVRMVIDNKRDTMSFTGKASEALWQKLWRSVIDTAVSRHSGFTRILDILY